jgi:hypothetical protein
MHEQAMQYTFEHFHGDYVGTIFKAPMDCRSGFREPVGDVGSPGARGMCPDRSSLACCRRGIVASSMRSTVADSPRGLGIRVYDTRYNRDFRGGGDDDLFEFRIARDLGSGAVG